MSMLAASVLKSTFLLQTINYLLLEQTGIVMIRTFRPLLSLPPPLSLFRFKLARPIHFVCSSLRHSFAHHHVAPA
jgi:hypothetical protein